MSKIPDHGWRESVAAFKADGFVIDRVEGDHYVLWKDGLKRPVIIPREKSLPKFIIQNNLRTAKMSRKRYLELLGKRKSKKKR